MKIISEVIVDRRIGRGPESVKARGDCGESISRCVNRMPVNCSPGSEYQEVP
jgi:hypothetical protein